MNRHAALAHMAAQTPPAFNGLFYATVATIIPVLFLALAVQGRMYGDLMTASHRALERFLAPGMSLRQGLAYFIWLLTMCIAGAIVLIAAFGEIAALLALYNQRQVSGVLPTTIALVLLVVLPPLLALLKFILVDTFVLLFRMLRRSHRSSTRAASAPEPAATTTAPTSSEPAPAGANQPSTTPPHSHTEEEAPPHL
jgi:hypothetical protein